MVSVMSLSYHVFDSIIGVIWIGLLSAYIKKPDRLYAVRTTKFKEICGFTSLQRRQVMLLEKAVKLHDA